MQPRPLTTWEQKERDGLLALETDEWRQKRLIAEDPNTTADVLENLAREIDAAWSQHLSDTANREAFRKGYYLTSAQGKVLLAQAVARNANTPPDTLRKLLGLSSVNSYLLPKHQSFAVHQLPFPFHAPGARGFCCNPIAPFVELEKPGFWQALRKNCTFLLLSDEALPSQIAVSLTRHSEKSVADEAKLHLSVVCELQGVAEGQAALTQFWRSYCETADASQQREYAALARFGMVPRWAGKDDKVLFPAALFVLRLLRRPFFVAMERRHSSSDSLFVRFALNLRDVHPISRLYIMGLLPDWTSRLIAALYLPLTDTSFSNEPWNRSPLELLQHLAHDGNRFVRWAARTRLADPDYVFTWHDSE